MQAPSAVGKGMMGTKMKHFALSLENADYLTFNYQTFKIMNGQQYMGYFFGKDNTEPTS